MGIWLCEINWDEILRPELNAEEQDHILRTYLQNKVDHIFPEKKFRISSQDLPFITSEIKTLQKVHKKIAED